MTKDEILEAIRQTARQYPNEPLGVAKFHKATGMRESDWRGVHWARWGDALEEAGLTRNAFNAAIPEELSLRKLADLVLKYRRMPTVAEIKLERRRDPTPRGYSAFKRLSTAEWKRKLRAFCASRPDGADVLAVLDATEDATEGEETDDPATDAPAVGEVYLLKSGPFHKIGRSNDAGIRGKELAIQLPEAAKLVHSIRTDDPPGVEAYWHRRFAARRKNGEWFDLTAADVRAFKRWRRIH